MARKRETLGSTTTPGGKDLVLTREEGYYVLTLGHVPLMSSAAHFSEEHMAEVGCQGMSGQKDGRVLIGGLGMGYTLRATLDRISDTGCAVVAELLPAVVEWNRGCLAELAGRPLDDPRTELVVRDIVAYVRSNPEPFDAILLDTDNGPDDFTQRGNAELYSPRGLAQLRSLLRPGGRLVVWSAYQHPTFTRDLERSGFDAKVVRVKSRGEKGGRHSLYVGHRREGASRRPRRPARGRRRRP